MKGSFTVTKRDGEAAIWMEGKEFMAKLYQLHGWMKENFKEPVEAIAFLRAAVMAFEEEYDLTFGVVETVTVNKDRPV